MALPIEFGFDSSEPTASGRRQLVQLGLAVTATELDGQTFLIVGHADPRGDAAYNNALSKRRADAIRDYLLNETGLSRHRVVAIGVGEAMAGDDAPAAQRKVEIAAF